MGVLKSNRVFSLGKEFCNEGSIVSKESESARTTKKPHRRNDEARCVYDFLLRLFFTPESLNYFHSGVSYGNLEGSCVVHSVLTPF